MVRGGEGRRPQRWHHWGTGADFCESRFTESGDWELDFSKKFLRVEDENESFGGKLKVENENEFSEGKNESWDWEWDSWIFKNEGLIKTESAFFMTLSIEIFMTEAKDCNELLKNYQ